MIGKPNNINYSNNRNKYNTSLSEVENTSFNDLTKLSNTNSMKNKVESDEGLKNLVYTHFKGWNE
jgi:hypothetical protein